MRNPHRWRTVGLTAVGIGLVGLMCVFLLPEMMSDRSAGLCFISGLMAIIFGGMWASWRHTEAKTQDALLRGEGVIASWRLNADTWREFVVLNRTFSTNELSVRNAVTAQGVEVIVGRSAIMVGRSVYTLWPSAMSTRDGVCSPRGDWVIEQATMGHAVPRCIYLYVRMNTSEGNLVCTNLIFPIAPDAEAQAAVAFDYLSSMAVGKKG
ncbi:MAG: hypothetical protein ABIQ97_01095 [Lysobacteraceae bacterium]